MLDPTGGPYSRFNARRATPEQVARDFIPPDYYAKLRDTIDPQLIIGPRGIGKTTLLKMLLPEAIDAWDKPEAKVTRERIGYTGVFVAADKLWAGQFDRLADPLQGNKLRADARKVFARAAFSYMALSAFAAAAAYRCRPDGDPSGFRWVKMSGEEQERLAAAVAPAWLAHPATATFSSLSEQMHLNVSTLGQLMQAAGMPGVTDEDLVEILKEPLLRVDFYTAAVFFIEAFNRSVGEPDKPWVLLIDEFEFLPPAARALLGEGFQGKDPRLSYKISLAPYTGLTPFHGSPFDDWDKIELLPPRKPEKDRFTKALLEKELAPPREDEKNEELARIRRRPEKVLKGLGFDLGGKSSFRPESRNGSDIKRLAEFDESFRKWLEKLLQEMTLEEAAEVPRCRKELGKAMPLVRLRLEYHKMRVEEERREVTKQRRPRHAIPISYGGWRNVYAISEGNPRWIKALAQALRDKYKPDARAIPPTIQTQAISEVAEKLYLKLKAVPIATSSGGEAQASITEYGNLTPSRLLDALGHYLNSQTHDRDFSPDVPGAFNYDVAKDEWLEEVLNSLVFLGAIIIEKRNAQGDTATFRLARMWAPIFRLLPRRGPPRSLENALNHTDAKKFVERRSPGQEKLNVEEEG